MSDSRLRATRATPAVMGEGRQCEQQLVFDAKLALRRLASSVSVVTCRTGGCNYAMTATAVSALSMEPPSMLLCVNRSAAFHRALIGANEFAINILSRAHVDISRFCSGGASPEDRFNIGDWDTRGRTRADRCPSGHRLPQRKGAGIRHAFRRHGPHHIHIRQRRCGPPHLCRRTVYRPGRLTIRSFLCAP